MKDSQSPPVKTDVGYALIALGNAALWSILNGWLLYFYLPPEGIPLVPVALYGVVTFLANTIRTLLDLPVGYLSDHSRSRWGRRLPLMFVSALPMLVFFLLLWTPPVKDTSVWNLVYLGGILLFYRVAATVLQIPHRALLPELALTDQHRARMSAWLAGFELLGMIAGSMAGLVIENLGYGMTMLLYAGAMLPLFYLPFLVLRERPGRQIAATERLDFRQSMTVTLGNRPFLVLIAARTLGWGATALLQAVIPFIVTEICLSTLSASISFYLPAVLTSLISYPLVSWLAGRLGKWRIFSGSLLASAIVLPGLMFIGNWITVPLLAQGIVWITLQAMAVSGFTVLSPAFVAEVTDYDEMLTGQRREGTYYATLGFVDHIANSITLAFLPLLLLLGRGQSDLHGPLGVRMVGIVGGVMMLAAFMLFLRYPFRRPPHKPERDPIRIGHDRSPC
jgi:GPH family glycoside/pentoside/hexuronide:cation symporter